jgi:hypothetical protein
MLEMRLFTPHVLDLGSTRFNPTWDHTGAGKVEAVKRSRCPHDCNATRHTDYTERTYVAYRRNR